MPSLPTAADVFQAAATAAKADEDDYRRQSAAEIARLTGARTTAFRRVRLIGLLEQALNAEADDRSPVERQQDRLCREFGWSRGVPAHSDVLDQIAPVCRALAPSSGTANIDDVRSALEDFEAWFLAARGTSVYALFDQYVQETPVVDF